jgi:hypothetical protein
MGYLALTSMGLGDKAAAFKLIERAMTVISIEKDAEHKKKTLPLISTKGSSDLTLEHRFAN